MKKGYWVVVYRSPLPNRFALAWNEGVIDLLPRNRIVRCDFPRGDHQR
jgi:hypothetical protein